MDTDTPISTRHNSFDDFFRTHRETVARALSVTFDDPDLAARVTDEAMIEAASDWKRFRTDASQAAAIFRRAFDLAIESRSLAGPVARPFEENPAPQPRPELQNRALTVAHILLGWPQADLARATGLSTSTVAKRLKRLEEAEAGAFAAASDAAKKRERVRRAMTEVAGTKRPPPGDLRAVIGVGRKRKVRRWLTRLGTTVGTATALVLSFLVLTSNVHRVTDAEPLDAVPTQSADGALMWEVATGERTAWEARTRRGFTLISDLSDRTIMGSIGRVLGRRSDLQILTSEDGRSWEARNVRDGLLRGVRILDIAEAAGVVTLLGIDEDLDTGAQVVLRSGDLDRWDRIDLVIPREGTPVPEGMTWAYDTTLVGAGEEVAVRVDAVAVRDFGVSDQQVLAASEDPSVGPPPVRRFYTFDDGEWTELDRGGIPDWNSIVDLRRVDETWYAAAVTDDLVVTYRLDGESFIEVSRVTGTAAHWIDGGIAVYGTGMLSEYALDGRPTEAIALPLASASRLDISGDVMIISNDSEVATVEEGSVRLWTTPQIRPLDATADVRTVAVSMLGDTLLSRPSDSPSTWWVFEWVE